MGRGFNSLLATLLVVAMKVDRTTPFAATSGALRLLRPSGSLQNQQSLHQAVFCDMEQEKREYNMNVGKAIDVLRSDVPDLLSQPPDLHIFTENVRVSDPSGQKLQGKMMYGQMYRLLRGMSSLALRNDSAVNARVFYDEPNAQIKVKVDADLIIAGGSLGVLQRNNEPLHLSVVSFYKLDRASGKVNHHVVDRVDLDGTEIDPLGFLSADRTQLMDWITAGTGQRNHGPLGTPVGYPVSFEKLLAAAAAAAADEGPDASSSSSSSSSSAAAAAASAATSSSAPPTPPSYLAARAETAMRLGMVPALAGSGGFGRQAQQQQKQKRRSLVVLQATSGEQKFDVYGNLIPPGREDSLADKVRKADGSRIPSKTESQSKGRNPGLLDFIKSVVDKSTPKQCEEDGECPGVQRCCDFGFANVCCSGGIPVSNELAPAYQPVPVPINDGTVGGGGVLPPAGDGPGFGGLPPPSSY